MSIPTLGHWINGGHHVSKSGRTAPVFDPALGVQTKHVALADQAEIDAAIGAAAAAFPAWRDTSITKRQQVIFKFRELLNERKGELAEIITSEHGKVVSDALGEVQRGLEVVDIAPQARITPTQIIPIEVGPQDRPAHAGRGFNRKHPLSGSTRPVRYRRL